MIKDIIKEISNKHGYLVTGSYWGRVGAMHKKYGEDALIQAIRDLPKREIPLTEMLNIVEKKAQYVLEHGDMDDLASEILNM